MKKYLLLIPILFLFSCQPQKVEIMDINHTAIVANGWQAEIIAQVNESYVGWDVEIGDADNDGENEILTTGCPNSKLFIFKKSGNQWESRLLVTNLANTFPGMGLAVKVVDLNADGVNEIIVGTGQEKPSQAYFHTFQISNNRLDTLNHSRAIKEDSGFTHNLAAYDLDKDGLKEVIATYCSSGEVIRFDYDESLRMVNIRNIANLSGSGEESIIADVDNDGQVEYITSNSFRKGAAKVEIFEFDKNGELVLPAKHEIDGFDGNGCFYASLIIGDVDNDGHNELVVGWKQDQKINQATILGYRITERVDPVYTFAYNDTSFDMSYFEKMMEIADADNDGKNELVISTRGDNNSELITSHHLGHVFMFTVDNEIKKELLLNFQEEFAESSWLAVGDADNDGKNEVVLATGKGDRTKAGESFIILLEKN